MGLFRRKKESDVTAENRAQISVNARSIEALIILARENEAFVAELRALQEKIKYLKPSAERTVISYDNKIKGLLEDLRIVLVKAEGNLPPKAESILTQIKVMVADRNAKD